MTFEEGLPDGGEISFHPSGARGSVRLHVRLENTGQHSLHVALCNGAVRVIPPNAPLIPCVPPQEPWETLPPGGSMLVFPTIPRPPAREDVFVEPLLPNLGHAPYDDWRTLVPNAVRFRLAPDGCSVVRSPRGAAIAAQL
jgi:hypothetical protein